MNNIINFFDHIETYYYFLKNLNVDFIAYTKSSEFHKRIVSETALIFENDLNNYHPFIIVMLFTVSNNFYLYLMMTLVDTSLILIYIKYKINIFNNKIIWDYVPAWTNESKYAMVAYSYLHATAFCYCFFFLFRVTLLFLFVITMFFHDYFYNLFANFVQHLPFLKMFNFLSLDNIYFIFAFLFINPNAIFGWIFIFIGFYIFYLYFISIPETWSFWRKCIRILYNLFCYFIYLFIIANLPFKALIFMVLVLFWVWDILIDYPNKK